MNNEAEYKAARLSITEQKRVDIDHRVIEGLNWYQAHEYVSNLWNKVRNRYDLMAKVDADSVLISNLAFSNVFELIHMHQAGGAHVRMLDFYSNSLIYGMNFYTPAVSFRRPRNLLYVDKNHQTREPMLMGEILQTLEPIAHHCLNPRNEHSYAYGYHRALKRHDDVLCLVAESFLREQNSSRMWALIGARDGNTKLLGRHTFTTTKLLRDFRKRERLTRDNLIDLSTEFAINLTRPLKSP